MTAPAWEPPPDPCLEQLARTGWQAWQRDRPTVISFDTETDGLSYACRAFSCQVAWWSEDVIAGPGVYGYYFELDRFDSLPYLKQIFAHAKVLVGHNIRFDLHRAEAGGWFTPDEWDGKEFHDTEAMSHLDDEHRPKGLKDLAVSVLGEVDTIKVPATRTVDGAKEEYLKEVPREKYEIGKAREWAKRQYAIDSIKDVGYHLLPRGTLVPYAISDAVWTFRLAQVLHPRILRYPDLTELYEREMLLTRTAVYSLEKAGMGTRPDYVAEQIKAYRKRVIAHELAIEQIVGKPVRSGKIPPKERGAYFNPSSNDEVRDYFVAAGQTRASYDAEALGGIDHPLARSLLAYRSDKKLLDTYFIGLQRDTGADGIYHTSLRQHGCVTGRTSAGAERGD